MEAGLFGTSERGIGFDYALQIAQINTASFLAFHNPNLHCAPIPQTFILGTYAPASCM